MNKLDAAAIEHHVDASAILLGLPITSEQRPGVLRYFAIAATLAEQVMSHPLLPVDEPAAVFVPVVPVAPMEPR